MPRGQAKKKKVADFLKSEGNRDPNLQKDYLKKMTFEDYENVYWALRVAREKDEDGYNKGACSGCVPSCVK